MSLAVILIVCGALGAVKPRGGFMLVWAYGTYLLLAGSFG